MDRTLVLGGAGFIGYHLVRHLSRSADGEILVVDNLSRGQADADFQALIESNGSIRFLQADLTKPEFFESLEGGFDSVYVLAGIVGVQNVQSAPERVLAVNSSIIVNTFDWLANAGCRRVLFASTSEAYGGSVELGIAPVPTPEGVPLTVRDVQLPRSTYALTKALGESFLTHYANAYGFKGVAVRFHNVYGPRMGYSHVIPELMQRVHARMDPLPVYGLDQTRAFCYVADAVRACELLMKCDLDGPQIVHVGNDAEEVVIAGLLEKLLRVTGFFPDVKNNPAAPGGVARRCPDISRLRALTGFEPEYPLEDGLRLTWDWYRRALSDSRAPTLQKV